MTSDGSALALGLAVVACLLCPACSHSSKLARIRSEELSATLSLPSRSESFVPDVTTPEDARRDTLTVTGLDGRETLIMRAVRDDESGEMVATEQIAAARVTAKFRNMAERHGKVNIVFQVTVPRRMQDSRWQTRLHPEMVVLGDTLSLDDIVITGEGYRNAQLRGYEQYERFLSRIISDTTRLYFMHDLEVFIERNIPELYAFKTDSSFVSDEQFSSVYGVTGKEAIEHYRRHVLMLINEHRTGRKDRMMRRYVKSPILEDGIRLDTVIRDMNGDFVYDYVQTINTCAGLRKVEVYLDGGIYEQDRKLYSVPRDGPLTFYISSLSTLADNTEKYLSKIIERRVEENTACYVDFKAGSSVIDESLGGNADEMERIRQNLRELLENQVFDLDSITVSASSSPEGREDMNRRLSASRAASMASCLGKFISAYRDTLRREAGFHVDECGTVGHEAEVEIPFKLKCVGEDWQHLDMLVAADSCLTDDDKAAYVRAASSFSDLDARERSMQAEPWYPYVRSELYPRLRTVRFNFFLHRKGMTQERVLTTEIDTLYMNGVQAIRERDYEAAVKMLSTYRDYNTAVAYVALDRNISAMEILETLDESPQVDYLKALVNSRTGKERDAVECYLRACQLDPQYVHRGNLDPEISSLIKAFGLNGQQ